VRGLGIWEWVGEGEKLLVKLLTSIADGYDVSWCQLRWDIRGLKCSDQHCQRSASVLLIFSVLMTHRAY
jgi:hypothetical protein